MHFLLNLNKSRKRWKFSRLFHSHKMHMLVLLGLFSDRNGISTLSYSWDLKKVPLSGEASPYRLLWGIPWGKFSFSDQNSVSQTYGGPFFLGGSIMGFPLRTWRTFFTYSSTSPLGTPVSSRAATHTNVLCIMALLALSLASLGANIICASRLTSSASITAWTWQKSVKNEF